MKMTEAKKYIRIIQGWELARNAKSIERKLVFKDFKHALRFVNNVGAIAEKEGHHPDILLHSWNKVNIRLSTHAIKGLSINDFILAAKIDRISG